MDAQYILTRGVLAKTPVLPLSEEEYSELAKAKATVVEAFGAEERVSLVFDNHIEFESVLLRSALERLIYAQTSWGEFSEEVGVANRLLFNLLSSCRSYLEQARHFTSFFFGADSDEFSQLKSLMSEQYDQKLGYRVLEALRNFASHRGRAVHGLRYQFWWVEDSDPRISRGTLIPYLRPARLREDGGFKSRILSELNGDEVDLRPLVRQYVAGISIVHGALRDLLKSHVEDADSVFLNAIDRYRREGEEKVVGLLAARQKEDGTWTDEVHLFENLVSQRRTLEVRHRTHQNLWKHHITTEPMKDVRPTAYN